MRCSTVHTVPSCQPEAPHGEKACPRNMTGTSLRSRSPGRDGTTSVRHACAPKKTSRTDVGPKSVWTRIPEELSQHLFESGPGGKSGLTFIPGLLTSDSKFRYIQNTNV